ncbi:MAG: right-handed parallel beta-helix repeat-containing protein [Planctomycetota bacterium]
MQGEVLQVTGDSQLIPGNHVIAPLVGEPDGGVLRLSGVSNLTLDLRGTTVAPLPGQIAAGQEVGTGLVIEGCSNVTVLGGAWRGFRTAIVVRNCEQVQIRDCVIDGFETQTLESTVTRDSEADWLRPMDYVGTAAPLRAAIEITGSKAVEIQNARARHGAIGAWLRDSRDCLITQSDLSFLSGYGVVLAGCQGCTVGYSSLEYVVRGYSHGTYSSGQNSAGVLIVGQSERNRVAFNRMTHCGSGVLVFGQGPIQPTANRLYGNDCRFAVVAGVRTRQTTDTIVQNNSLSGALGWGLCSYGDRDLVVLDNEMSSVAGPGIGLYASTDASLLSNRLQANQVGLEIAWENPESRNVDAPVEGVSRGHVVVGNRFEDNGLDLVGRDSQALSFAGNQFYGERQRLHVERIGAWLEEGEDPAAAPGEDTVVGWLAGSNGVTPTGNLAGVTLRLWNGELPAPMEAAKAMAPPRVPGFNESDGRIQSEYRGGAETVVIGLYGPWDFPSGEAQVAMRQPGGLFSRARWQATWFAFDPQTRDPRGDLNAWRALAETPIVRRTVDHFLEPRPGAEIQGRVPPVRFGLLAETTVDLPESGDYRLSVMSDDGIRVWIGDKMVFEDWTWHATRQKDVVVHLPAGKSPVRFEYFQLDGAAELVLELHKAR